MGASLCREWGLNQSSLPSCTCSCCPCPFPARGRSYAYEYCNNPSEGSDGYFKVVLVGRSSGKTCLRNRIVEGRWTPQARPTQGVDYNVRKIDVAGQELKLQICDLSSDDESWSLASRYLKLADGVLLIYDVTNRDSWEYIREMVAEEHLKGCLSQGAGLMLIGNKADSEESLWEVSRDEGQRYADELGIPFLETSAKTGLNVLRTVYLVCTNMMLRRSSGRERNRIAGLHGRGLLSGVSASPVRMRREEPPSSADFTGTPQSSDGYVTGHEEEDFEDNEESRLLQSRQASRTPSREKKESFGFRPKDCPREAGRVLSGVASPSH